MKAKDKFSYALREHAMINHSDRVLVAVSGGPDSICLLSLFFRNASDLGVSVAAAHVNHGIRGKEADRDEMFVREFCSVRGIPLHVFHADVPAESRTTGESPELVGRRIRYQFFESLGYDKIATAHTGDDRVETMLMNLSRGTSLHGLCSIPYVRGNIIRPLLDCSRQEILSYCKENALTWVTDETNGSDLYTRNRFRRRIVPVLSEENPAFADNVLRCLRSLNLDDEYICMQVSSLLPEYEFQEEDALRIEALQKEHPAIRLRLIAAFLTKDRNVDPEERHIRMLDEHARDPSFAVDLPGEFRAKIKDGLLRMQTKIMTSSRPEEVRMSKNEPGTFPFGDSKITVTIGNVPFHGKNDGNILDFSLLDDIIILRARADGDALFLSHRGCTKSLKKLFLEAGIPASDRLKIPVVADSRGVIWAGGFGGDGSRLARDGTEKTLIIRTECGNNDK